MLNGFINKQRTYIGIQSLNGLIDKINRMQKINKTIERKEKIKKIINK